MRTRFAACKFGGVRPRVVLLREELTIARASSKSTRFRLTISCTL
jgi:hypothetical protein